MKYKKGIRLCHPLGLGRREGGVGVGRSGYGKEWGRRCPEGIMPFAAVVVEESSVFRDLIVFCHIFVLLPVSPSPDGHETSSVPVRICQGVS